MRKILLIEDEDGMRKLIKQRLSDTYEIIETGDGTEALGLALEHKPDCILLDLMMPRYSGLELCQTLAAVSPTQKIPIFVITGQAAADLKAYCVNLGAWDYFEKPIDFARLKATLADALKDQPVEQNSEPSVHLKVIVKLRGTEIGGKEFELLTWTDEVSVSGFLCRCSVPLAPDATVEVMVTNRNGERRIGLAQLRNVVSANMPWQACSFKFTGEKKDWVL
ncbi:MAG TPA: response regulator [Candidatus Acidoferrales bacterium]